MREVRRRLGCAHIERGLLRVLPGHGYRLIDDFDGLVLRVRGPSHEGESLILTLPILVPEAVRQLDSYLLLLGRSLTLLS